jgi:alkylated DNA repair dioxygenase AlkB
MTICKHFVLGTCTRSPCKFEHKENVCLHYFRKGQCKFGNQCHKIHIEAPKEKKKNTESFTPSFTPSDMRMMMDTTPSSLYPFVYQSNDVFVTTHLFPDVTYEDLLREMKQDVFTLWHGDSHMIANDHVRWKEECPVFQKVIQRMKEYYQMDVKASRFNLYRDGSDWKPFHHDAAAVDHEKAKTQNWTIGVSFGEKRSACFEHAVTKKTVELPLENGSVYGFGSRLNKEWRHGILPLKEPSNNGRISIIIWGWIDEKKV